MKAVTKYLIWAGFCFMLGYSYEYQLPKIESWLIVKTEEFSRNHLPIRILPEHVELRFFPLGLHLKGIRALPKADLAKTLAPLKIESAGIEVRPLSLLTGDFRIFRIEIVKPEITLITVRSEASTEEHVDFMLKDLLHHPLYSLSVNDALIQVRSPQAELLIRSENTSFHLENRRDRIGFEINFEKIQIKLAEKNSLPALVTVVGAGIVKDDEVLLKALKVTQGSSFVILSGSSGGRPLLGKFQQIQAKARTHIELETVLKTLKSLRQDLELPKITGEVDTEISFAQQPDGSQLVSTDLSTRDLRVEQFEIGKAEGKIDYDLTTWTTKELTITNSAGKVNLKDASFSLAGDGLLKATAIPERLELRALLMSLGVGDSPLHLLINGNLPCEGKLKPEFKLSCTGSLGGTDFWVKNPAGKTIVALDTFMVDGSVTVDSKGVYPKAQISIGASTKGQAEGSIEYATGFEFKYKTDSLNVNDIKTLAGLKLEGKAKLEGTVDGNSDTAKFGMSLKTDNFWFEDYGVGNASANFQFLKGVLFFKNIDGFFNTTRYYASVTVDLNKETIQADGKLGFAEARDLQSVFSRKVQLPFESYGNLTGRLSVSGPLQFNQLTYDMEATLYRGTIGSEAFDELKFNVASDKGHVSATQIYLKKGLGIATMTGTGKPSGQIDTIIKARGFRLEDLSLFNQNESTITGQVNFDMTMKGHVLSPDTDIKGDITQTTIARDPVPDSRFDLRLTRTSFAGKTYFLNEKVWLDFDIPFDNSYPFKFKGKSNQWNFSPLFGLLTNASANKEFETELTSEFDLNSAKGGFWSASGQIRVAKLRIRRGNLELHNPQTSIASFENGRMSLKNFLLQGDNTFLKAEANGSKKDDLGISINGKIEMSLLSFLTPFFSDMRGVLSSAIQLDGTADNPKVIGSAFIDKGFIKLKELPHAFENIRADLLFNHKRIVVNSLQSVFAGGNAIADGTVEIKGLRDVPVELKGRFDKVNLLVPKDFNSRGSGDFKVTGNWFPYLLSGNYRMSGGLISKELGDDTDSASVKRSSLLPSSFQEQTFSAIRFDLNTFFPSNVFVRNALVDTEIRGNLRIQGTPEDPSIIGEITAPPGGKIMFRDVPFEISSANIRFTDPVKINPTMYAAATTRLQDYDVNFILQGNRENYRINLRSTPPLPEADIISLLALGYTPQQLERVKSDQQIDQQSYEIGGALLSNNPLGNEIKSKYGINVRFGSAVDDATQTVAPKVIVSKQWSPKFNTSASRTVGNVVSQDVKAEYQLNRNVSVIGSWEGKEFTEEQKTTEQTSKSTDILGLDLQYRMEFR